MGKRGPRPKPTVLRVLEGNPGRLPINGLEPVPTGDPVCPDYLCTEAKSKWRDTMVSVPPGQITAADGPLLEAYCETWALIRKTTEVLDGDKNLFGHNLVVYDKPSPYLKIRNEAIKTLASLATRLGLSPADRSGLKLQAPQGGGKWARLIG